MTLRSQSLSVAKDTLPDDLAHLEDAFLVRTVAMHIASERQRMVNPRRSYPIDPAPIALFDRSGREQVGRALETVVLIELHRRGWEVTWVRTASGWEVDFIAHRADDPPLLIQVSLDTEAPETWDREMRALEEAAAAHPNARPLLITLDDSPPRRPLPAGMEWTSAARWLLAAE
jgi:uncharacterized protein